MAAVRLRAAAELSLGEKLRDLHWPFVTLFAVIGVIGYAVLYSAGGGSHEPWAWRHGVRLAVGIPVMIAVAMIDQRFWYKIAYPLYAVSLAMLVLVDILGLTAKGAQRWLDLGVIQLQPSEFMKVALVLALARYFHSAYLSDVKRPLFLLPPLAMIGAPAALVLIQPDLGTAVMLGASGVGLLFMAGVRIWKFLLAGGLAGAALPVAWANLHDYQRQRVYTFLDPENDPLGTGYHIIQSKIALGSGGFWGKGFLNGSQAQLNYLPEKQTDFAFTMMAEEVGFVGAVVVLALFFALLLLGLAIALRAPSQFSRLVAAGMVINLTLYVVINVSMVTGLIPVVGIPLPLISYGGTAMLTSLVAAGLILGADAHRHQPLARFPVDL
jgi:rod shape determining protein RodA